MKQWDVLVYGDINVDLIVPGVAALPAPGQKTRVEQMPFFPGGGAMAAVKGKIHETPAFFAKAVDTTGAGDSFNAGFLYAHLQGWDVQRCLQTGNACGALSVQKPGGNGGFPTLPELQRFLNANK